MPGPDTAVEEAPVLVAFFLALSAFISWCFYTGLLWTWIHTVGYVIRKLVGILSFHVPLIGRVDFGAPLLGLDNTVEKFLGNQAAGAQLSMAHWFHAAWSLQRWLVSEIAHLGEDVWKWGDTLQNHYLPKWLKAAIKY